MNAIIPAADPAAGVRIQKKEIMEAVERVLDSGSYILGPEVEAFEKTFSALSGTRWGVAVASGTDALELALRAIGISSNDAVVTVSHTSVATVAAIERSGAIPILIDIDPHTGTLCPKCLAAVLKDYRNLPGCHRVRVKAVIPVHIYGFPADMPSICAIASHHGVAVIEDCAQAHGALIDGKPVGGFGTAGAFSFYPTKNIGAIGDAGIVVTNDELRFLSLLQLRQYGWSRRYISEIQGINSRLDELQAAILLVRLKKMAENIESRRRIASRYDERLRFLPIHLPPQAPSGWLHAYHLYVIRTPARDALRAYLASRGIYTAVHYPVPVHRQPAYSSSVIFPGELPVTDATADQILSLPMYPELEDIQVDRICNAIVGFFGKTPT